RFTGYAAIFSTPDAGRDVLLPGAFGRIEAAPPLVWQHDLARPVGRIEALQADQRGLKVQARLSLESTQGRDAWALLASGALNGLSIGYRARRSRLDAARRLRLLEQVELVEISLVTLPMHGEARVIALG
ncbi:MAG: HK97 family phage prohead protease, partial [Rhodocyclaceae bacterium]|nr:HK97 family phage prohead protease [Rhodocyclaceae bacterium]